MYSKFWIYRPTHRLSDTVQLYFFIILKRTIGIAGNLDQDFLLLFVYRTIHCNQQIPPLVSLCKLNKPDRRTDLTQHRKFQSGRHHKIVNRKGQIYTFKAGMARRPSITSA